MNLAEYFEKSEGRGVLATSDASGRVGIAVYSRPHVIDEHTVAFIMADRQSHANLQSNPRAAYLFMEAGPKYVGKRLYLTKTKEEADQALIDSLRRKKSYTLPEGYKEGPKYLVYFKVDDVLPLVGDKT